MWWIGCVRCEKSRRDFVARTFALIAPVDPILHRVSCSYETIPNAPKHYETYQNMILGPMGRIGCVRCEKSRRDFVAPCFSSGFMQLGNNPKCTQILCNAPKHEFRVQWCGLGVFIEKNPSVTSWHELSH